MATDPVEQVTLETANGLQAAALLQRAKRLADAPAGLDRPYLSATIDLTPDGSNPDRRLGREQFNRTVADALAALPAHEPARTGLESSMEQVFAALDGLDVSVAGAFVFAGGPEGLAETIPSSLPLPTHVTFGPIPALLDLVHLAEGESSYVVLAADQKNADLLVVSAASLALHVSVQASGYPRKQEQGGWSQRRYQARADERVEAFARMLAQEMRRLVEAGRIEGVVLASDEPMRSAVSHEFHEMVTEKVVGEVGLLVETAPQTIIDVTRPVVQKAERAQEGEMVQAVADGAGPGGRSVTGAEETVAALQTGQVMTVVMNDDFAGPAWADFDLGSYGVGQVPTVHPAGGDPADLYEVALAELVVRLGLQTDAAFEIVQTAAPVTADETVNEAQQHERTPAARQLDDLGGIGAVLRYTLSADRSTARM